MYEENKEIKVQKVLKVLIQQGGRCKKKQRSGSQKQVLSSQEREGQKSIAG